MTCDTLVKPTCVEANHKTHNILEEAEECQVELDQVTKGLEEIAKDKEGSHILMIQSAIVSCQEMSQLTPRMKTSAVIRKRIEKMKTQLERAKTSEPKVYNHYFIIFCFKKSSC